MSQKNCNFQTSFYQNFQCTQTLQEYESTAGVFSSDGKTFIVGCRDKTIKLKDVQTGKDVRILSGLAARAVVFALSQDGLTLCVGDDSYGINVWDLNTGKVIHSLKNTHSNVITSLAICPKGKTLISGSWDWSIKVWDLETGKVKHHLSHNCGVYALAIAADGKSFFSAGNTKEIRIWHLKTGKVVGILEGHLSIVGAIALTPDGKFLVSGSGINTFQTTFDELALETGQYRSIKIWNLQTGQEVGSFTGHQDNICALAISADGQTLVSGSDDYTIKVWDLPTGLVRYTLTGYRVRLVALSLDGQTLASLGDGTLKFWNLTNGQLVSSYSGHSSDINCLALSPDRRVFASGSDDRQIKLWDLQTYQEIWTLQGQPARLGIMVTADDQIVSWSTSGDRSHPGHAAAVSCLVFSRDGKRLISGSNDSTIKVWDLPRQQVIQTLKGHTKMIFSLAVHPGGQTLISSSLDHTLKLWNLQTGELIRTLVEEYYTHNILAGVEVDTFFCGGTQKAIQIRHWHTGELLRQIGEDTDGNLSLAVSHDRQFLVGSGVGGKIKVWHLGTGELLHSIQLNPSFGLCGATSPDDKFIVVGAEDNRIGLCNRQTGENFSLLMGHRQGGVRSLLFSSHGQSIISGSGDGAIEIWENLSCRGIADPELILI